MLALLQIHAQRQLEEKAKAGSNWEENDLVFSTVFGKPIDHHRLYDYYKEKLRELGLPNLRFHDLRQHNSHLDVRMGDQSEGSTRTPWGCSCQLHFRYLFACSADHSKGCCEKDG